MLSGHQILVRPIVTEKNTALNEVGKYCFEVIQTANKIEIKRAVEQLLGAKVAGIRTNISHGKVKRQGRFAGQRPDWKKAYVKLKAGEKTIEFFEGA
jgi:large subunit ribosomal protein L23